MKIHGHGFNQPKCMQFFNAVCNDLERRNPLPDLGLRRMAGGLQMNGHMLEALVLKPIGQHADFIFQICCADIPEEETKPNQVRLMFVGIKNDAVAFHTTQDVAENTVNLASFVIAQWLLERSGYPGMDTRTKVEDVLFDVYRELPRDVRHRRHDEAEKNKVLTGTEEIPAAAEVAEKTPNDPAR
jgi:hypothetical protein